MTLTLQNTLTRTREKFTPLNKDRVTLYACGPTVYDRPHLGNARAVVVYDILFRILRLIYGESDVVYARNITDVDDKIITAANARGISINELTTEVTAAFHHDIGALNCIAPTHEPRATDYIAQMITMIETLIANEAAYVSEGHVLFSVESGADYGKLSGRKLEDLVAGARVEVASYKRHPGDFVLWKPATDEGSSFDSPWGKGRPGWHIECSAMSTDLLGDDFDIHGGGADLKFPHHENEIAQSCGANPDSHFAKYWVHNGFLTISGEKMSKSLGNFTTVHDLLEKGIHGETIRLAFLMTKYNEPLDWNEKLLSDAKKTLDSWYRKLQDTPPTDVVPSQAFVDALRDDMNLPLAISHMHKAADGSHLKAMGDIIGVLQQDANTWFKGEASEGDAEIQTLIDARIAAKKAKDFAESDRIRTELDNRGIILEDKRDGTTDWRRS
ncbi:MAG: cysteine--tRNA ligase [Rickettsiales bacterium]|nr:cysteine--tRNA ligase [Rickettsiales bacterium]